MVESKRELVEETVFVTRSVKAEIDKRRGYSTLVVNSINEMPDMGGGRSANVDWVLYDESDASNAESIVMMADGQPNEDPVCPDCDRLLVIVDYRDYGVGEGFCELCGYTEDIYLEYE